MGFVCATYTPNSKLFYVNIEFSSRLRTLWSCMDVKVLNRQPTPHNSLGSNTSWLIFQSETHHTKSNLRTNVNAANWKEHLQTGFPMGSPHAMLRREEIALDYTKLHVISSVVQHKMQYFSEFADSCRAIFNAAIVWSNAIHLSIL